MVLACSSLALNIGTVEYGTAVVGATTSANTPILKLTLTMALLRWAQAGARTSWADVSSHCRASAAV
jgi:hypothetical protein